MLTYDEINYLARHHGVSSEEQLFKKLLARLSGKTVVDQLRQARAKEIRWYVGTLNCGFGWMSRSWTAVTHHAIWLNYARSIVDCAETVGHELGHAFISYKYDSQKGAITRIYPFSPENEEQLCDKFMKWWIREATNHADLERVLDEFHRSGKEELVIF